MVAPMPYDLAGEERADHLDRLEHHGAADPDLRPDAAYDMLIKRLAGPQPQPETPRIHGAQRGGGMGDHPGVIAEAGTRDSRAEAQAGPLAQRPHEGPREGGVALLRRPGVEVL